MGTSKVNVKLYLPEKREPIPLFWPDGVQIPGWGDTFTYEGVEWLITDVVWVYENGPLQALDITYKMYLNEDDGDCDCYDDD